MRILRSFAWNQTIHVQGSHGAQTQAKEVEPGSERKEPSQEGGKETEGGRGELSRTRCCAIRYCPDRVAGEMTCIFVSMGKLFDSEEFWPWRDSGWTYLHVGMDARPSSSSTTAGAANVRTPGSASDSDLRVVRAADTTSGWAVLPIRAPGVWERVSLCCSRTFLLRVIGGYKSDILLSK